jgi:hypothetical protein
MAASGADMLQDHCRWVGLTKGVAAPAMNRTRGVDSAAVISARVHRSERQFRRTRLPMVVPAPAHRRSADHPTTGGCQYGGVSEQATCNLGPKNAVRDRCQSKPHATKLRCRREQLGSEHSTFPQMQKSGLRDWGQSIRHSTKHPKLPECALNRYDLASVDVPSTGSVGTAVAGG